MRRCRFLSRECSTSHERLLPHQGRACVHGRGHPQNPEKLLCESAMWRRCRKGTRSSFSIPFGCSPTVVLRTRCLAEDADCTPTCSTHASACGRLSSERSPSRRPTFGGAAGAPCRRPVLPFRIPTSRFDAPFAKPRRRPTYVCRNSDYDGNCQPVPAHMARPFAMRCSRGLQTAVVVRSRLAKWPSIADTPRSGDPRLQTRRPVWRPSRPMASAGRHRATAPVPAGASRGRPPSRAHAVASPE